MIFYSVIVVVLLVRLLKEYFSLIVWNFLLLVSWLKMLVRLVRSSVVIVLVIIMIC